MRRGSEARLLPRLALSASSIAVALGLSAGWIRLSHAALVVIALLALCVGLLRSRPTGRFWLVAALVTLAPILLMVLGGGLSDPYPLASSMVLLAFTWASVLPLWGRDMGPVDAPLDAVGPGAVVLLVGALTAVSFVAPSPVDPLYSFVVDESLYLLQSSTILDDPRGLSLPPVLEPFFRIRYSYYRDGFLNGQYPPGWPLIIAGFREIGLLRIAFPLIYLATVSGVAVLARILGARWSVVLLAVALTGSWPVYLAFVNSYFAHAATGALGLGASICLIAGHRASGSVWRSRILFSCGGLLLGMVGASRPLTGLVACVWAFWWFVFVRPVRVRSLLLMGIGVSIPGMGLLWYNRVTTGSPLRFGYDLANDGLQALGPGDRGQIWFTSEGIPLREFERFSVLDMAGQVSTSLAEMVVRFWPGGLILVLAAVAFHYRSGPDWRKVVPFLFLPIAYGVYFFQSLRFLMESFPLAMVATALLAQRLGDSLPDFNDVVPWATVALSLAVAVPGSWGPRDLVESRVAYFRVVEEERDRRGPLLVFVAQDRAPGQGVGEHALEALYSYNARPERGVTVVRDVESRRSLVLARYPDRTPIRIVTGPVRPDGTWPPPSVEPLASRNEGGLLARPERAIRVLAQRWTP